jgi:hypothetical protein
METFSDRMKWLVKKFGKGRKHTFGKMLMIPKGTMQRYVEDRIPDTEYIVRMHETFGVNLNWFFTGKGDPLIGESDKELAKLRADFNVLGERLAEREKAVAGHGKIRQGDPKEKADELIRMRSGVISVDFKDRA